MSATFRAGTLVGPEEMTGDQMVAAMDAVGVDGAVLVSLFSTYRYDPCYVLEVQAKHPDRFCLVKPVDPNDPAVADIIADWKAKKGTVGVRVIMRDNVSTDPADPGVNRVLAAAAKHSLAVKSLHTMTRPTRPQKTRTVGLTGADRWSPGLRTAAGRFSAEQAEPGPAAVRPRAPPLSKRRSGQPERCAAGARRRGSAATNDPPRKLVVRPAGGAAHGPRSEPRLSHHRLRARQDL